MTTSYEILDHQLAPRAPPRNTVALAAHRQKVAPSSITPAASPTIRAAFGHAHAHDAGDLSGAERSTSMIPRQVLRGGSISLNATIS